MENHSNTADDQVPNLGIVESSKDVGESSAWHGPSLSRRGTRPPVPSVHGPAAALLAPPTTAATTAWAGWLLALTGEWERGLHLLMQQLDLQPGYPAWLHHAEFLYHYQRRDYETALEASKKFDMPSIFWDPLDRAAVLGQLDRSAEAKEAIDEMLTLQPKVAHDPLRFLKCFIFQDELIEHVLEGLNTAGLGD